MNTRLVETAKLVGVHTPYISYVQTRILHVFHILFHNHDEV